MPTIKLGPEGSETTLPQGVKTETPVNIRKNISMATMSDGSTRYAFYKRSRIWRLQWIPLSFAEMITLRELYMLNQVLRFQNNYESSVWYDVVITNLSYTPVIISGVEKYWVEMEIEELASGTGLS